MIAVWTVASALAAYERMAAMGASASAWQAHGAVLGELADLHPAGDQRGVKLRDRAIDCAARALRISLNS